MNSGDQRAFAALLRRLRIAAGLTQQELAERAGISVRSVSDLERVVNERPRRDTAQMLAAGLGLSGAERERFLDAARRRPRSTPGSSIYAPLPEPATALLGRAFEIQAIEDAFATDNVRLLTLTGPGGVGKTRLAIEAARLLAGRSGGVLFLRLDGLTDPALVLPTLAGALQLLEIGDAGSLPERIAAHLEQQELLIVLDNLEHLLAAAGDLADLAGRSSQSRFLVTSRESLRVSGEHVIPVPPLPRPDPATWHMTERETDARQSPAIDLFIQRARTIRPDLTTAAETADGRANLAVIAEICHRLDGLPLAIELAAAQAQVLSPAAILALLKDAMLPLFAAGGRDQPPRFQTMDAAIDWSYSLLPDNERVLFRALSVFAAGFTLPAVAVIGGAADPSPDEPFDPQQPMRGLDLQTIGGVATLVRKHLLVEDTSPSNDVTTRFRMLEPIRLFGLDRLRETGEEPPVRRRHARFFVRLAEALDALTFGPDPEVWLRQEETDLDNVRAALDWALAAGEYDLTVRLTNAVAQLWEIRGMVSEARGRVSRAITVDSSSIPASRWFLRFWAGTFAFDRGDVAEAMRWARELLAIGETLGEPLAAGAGFAALSRATGVFADRHEEAADLARRAVATFEPLGHDEWTAWGWTRLGIEDHLLGRLEDARASLLKGMETRQRKGCEGCVAYSLVSLGAVSADLGEPVSALDTYRESLRLTIKHENQALMLAVLLGLADVAWQFGAGAEPERDALLLFGAAEAVWRRHDLGRRRAALDAIARWQLPMREALGDEAVDGKIGEGMLLARDEVVALANDLQVSARRRNDTRLEPGRSLLAGYGSIE